MKKETPLFWPAKVKGNVLYVLDETAIPKKVTYVKVKNANEAVDVIRQMKTRAFGQFLVVLNAFLLELANAKRAKDEYLVKIIHKTAQALNASRPTFPFAEVTSIVELWAEGALNQGQPVRPVLERNICGYLEGIRAQRMARVQKLEKFLKNKDSILTHCNVSGELALAAQIAKGKKKSLHFFVTETRPYFQGAKLTAWELSRAGVDVTLIADNAIGSIIADGLVDKVVVGSDRNCANGDFANKIGTYQIAVLAKEFGVPFYVLTQPSQKIKTGADIPVEIRDERELLSFEGQRIAPAKVKGFYPGFDIVPHTLITESIAINVRG